MQYIHYKFRDIDNKKQSGGTFLGIIIGLIIGLAIALGVALVITKGATPFTNKNGKSEKASESLIEQIVDPNKPLYGNQNSAKSVAKDATKNGEEKQVDPKSEVKPGADTKPALDAKLIDENKPLVETKETKEAKKSDKVDSTVGTVGAVADEKWLYYLQVGAFREMTDAENSRAKLALLGFEASVSDRVVDNGHLYRVRIGPFNQIEAANRIRGKLSDNGIDVAVIRNQK